MADECALLAHRVDTAMRHRRCARRARPGFRGACHRAALRADPLASSGLRMTHAHRRNIGRPDAQIGRPKAGVNDVRDGLGPYLAVDGVTALRTGNRTFPRVL